MCRGEAKEVPERNEEYSFETSSPQGGINLSQTPTMMVIISAVYCGPCLCCGLLETVRPRPSSENKANRHCTSASPSPMMGSSGAVVKLRGNGRQVLDVGQKKGPRDWNCDGG